MSRKRDELAAIEKTAQEQWEAEKAFEVNAPENGKEKSEETYFVTFPYPYMNGRLHLGHVFTISKAEFAVGYQRLKGKVTFFPFGFHCTGMPIKASADILKEEIDTYGNPPQFPVESKPEAKGGKKSKVAAKEGAAKRKWDILKGMEIPEEEIVKFCDASYWLEYFPPRAQQDLVRFGLKTDWRRSFITTDVNPFYDAFVRWQLNMLKELGYIEFGNRPAIFCPKDGQPCMDHDRSKGEGVAPQEYTGIKMKVLELPESLKQFEGKDVFLVAATLRPETMYGQTNCWMSPDIKYIAWKTKSGEVFVTTRRAARNMSFQYMTEKEGEVEVLAEIPGKELMGVKLDAPLSAYDHIYTLPMMTILESKGTGVVTSVPSDSPDDYAAMQDIKNKEKLREKFGITDEMVMPYDPIAIISTPTLGDMAAVKACTDAKVKSQNDRAKLADLKEKVYKEGFYQGTMIVGEHKGKKVQDIKDVQKQSMIDAGTAINYYEPENLVVSRSGDTCVVAFTDQWYLCYGKDGWKQKCERALENLNVFHHSVRKDFEHTLDWLKEHACSRTYGLGSKLPWDENWLIESLSDSTIYMAYYTIAHFLQGGEFRGANGSPLGIKPEQCDYNFFNYVFLSDDKQPKAEDCQVPKDVMDKLRNEFLYLYPMDLRVSGKDLVPNHLTYSLYNHCAIWDDEKMWPRAFRANGHLLLNGKKMSKSEGNFLTLYQALDKYGTDATRMSLADAGDGVDDANFEEKAANANVLRLHKELEWVNETIQSLDTMRTGDMTLLADRVFINEINSAIVTSQEAYEGLNFRDALKYGFFNLQAARDRYRKVVTQDGSNVHRDLVMRFIEVQTVILSPICPHICEHIWKLIGKNTSILNACYPVGDEVDDVLLMSGRYLDSVEIDVRKRVDKLTSGKKKIEVNEVTLFVAKTYPPWQEKVLAYLRENFNGEVEGDDKMPDMKTASKHFKSDDELKAHKKKLMPFVAMKRSEALSRGIDALSATVPFDEMAVLTESQQFLQSAIGKTIIVKPVDEADEKIRGSTSPGQPSIVVS
eukprot:m.30897 g.30897  ORF g.30897 m.30897 type:complete len:1042 (-) comp9675_c0_seq1:131-3256(-)